MSTNQKPQPISVPSSYEKAEAYAKAHGLPPQTMAEWEAEWDEMPGTMDLPTQKSPEPSLS